MKLRSSKAIESNSKSDDNTDIYDEINADKQNDSINNGLEIELKSDTSDTVRSYNCRKLNDIEIDLLKAYLNENIFIHSTEAKSRLEKETGIEAGVYSVSQKLRFLKKKMVKEYAKQRLAITESGKKVKRFHLEHLKKYLRENSSIEPSEARDRLQKDTGLKVHITTANKHLNLLKEGIGSGCDKLDMIRSNSTEALTKLIYEYELSNTHIEYLKKLLKEDNYIESVEARNRIQEEMDVDLNINSIHRNLKKLKKEMGLECTKRRKHISIFDIRKRRERGAKIKCYHLEYLYKCLKEDISIDPAEAKDRLQKDTGLSVNITTVRNTLFKLKKELDRGSSSLESSISTQRGHATQRNYEYLLNNVHVERLKKYLNEDSSIDHIKARNKLQEDTGLNARIQTVKTCLSRLRKEMGINPTNLNLPTNKSKEQTYGYKIKDAEIERLKMYLREDRFILSTVAKYRLQKETGFEISIYSIKKALIRLRKEIYPDNAKMRISNSTNIPRGYKIKIKDVHIEHLKKYLKEDILIRPGDARYKLQEDTGIQVSSFTVQRTLNKLKEEMYLEHDIPTSCISHSKAKKPKSSSNSLNDVNVDSLRGYLKEDSFIDSVEAIGKFEKDKCLNINYLSVKNDLNIKTEVKPSKSNINIHASNSVTKITESSNMRKLEDNHIECLKRYLSEDSSIGITEARDRLQKDTGLVARAQTINAYLSRIKKEVSLENASKGSYTVNNRRSSRGNILNGTRLEFLEVYFNEDSSIMPAEAKNILQEETGLDVDIVDIRKTLNMLRKEM